MAIWRGVGGSGESTNDSTVPTVTALLVDAEAARDAAQLAETNAETAASNAASSASTASTQASNATTSATNAASSASAASTSATNAASSASTASTQASNAASSASAASTSASNAASSASSAAGSASTATTKASEASTSATNAASSATAAASSASSAATQASNAASSASAASTSASNAATSESNAASSASAAAASYDSFDDRYLGAKSSAPTLDNDGNALLTGALYFNTSTNEMKVWSGSAWLNAYASLSGALLATNNLSDLNNVATARTNLGLGTAATQNSTAFATAAQGTNADTAYGWGNHALAGYAADSAVVKLTGNQTIAGTKTFSSNPILSAGTANGVLYLNGSKVATSGSALTFDGTNFATTGAGTFSGLLSRIHAQGTDAYITNTTTGKANTVMGFNDSGSNTAQGIPTGYSYYGNLQTYPIGFTSGGYLTNSISSTAHIWNTTGSEQMRLTSTGLGIGTSSPAYKLDVSSSAEVVGRFARSAGSNALLLIQDPTTTAAPYIASYGNAMAFGRYGGGESVRIDSNGNFLVNTTTSITGSNRMVVRQSGTSNPSTALNSGSWTGAFVSGEPALQLSSNIVAATGIPGSTETARGGIGFEYISSANPTDFIIGIFGSPTVASPVKFFNGSERMRLDSSGNLGLGVTPSAWSGQTAFQTNGGSLATSNTATLNLTQNAYYNGTSWTRVNALAASMLQQSGGAFNFFTAGSSTAGSAITFTQAMTLDASGNLLLGSTVSPSGSSNLSIKAGQSVQWQAASASTLYADIYADTSNNLVFRTGSGPSERARIDSSGNLLVGTTSVTSYIGSTVGALANVQSTNGSNTNAFVHSGTTPYGAFIYYPNATPNGTINQFLVCQDSSAVRFQLRSNGGLGNYSANNVNLSDRREKTNFAPAGEYLSKICAIPVQTFNYIDQNLEEDGGLTLGVVAQDVQAVAPELVSESNWGTEEDPKMRLSIYQTDLQYALMKCIQEQQAIIEQLKARLDAANL